MLLIELMYRIREWFDGEIADKIHTRDIQYKKNFKGEKVTY